MKKIGRWTGIVYPDDVDDASIGECFTLIPPERENDKEWLHKLTASNKVLCGGCIHGCRESRHREVYYIHEKG